MGRTIPAARNRHLPSPTRAALWRGRAGFAASMKTTRHRTRQTARRTPTTSADDALRRIEARTLSVIRSAPFHECKTWLTRGQWGICRSPIYGDQRFRSLSCRPVPTTPRQPPLLVCVDASRAREKQPPKKQSLRQVRRRPAAEDCAGRKRGGWPHRLLWRWAEVVLRARVKCLLSLRPPTTGAWRIPRWLA